MLVLSRKQSERIRVGQDIVVTVVRVAGDKVRLGIEAPPDVVVLRDELRPFSSLAGAGISASAAVNLSASAAGNLSASAAGNLSASAAGSVAAGSAANSN
jgi:carbon storage regulator